MQKVCKVAVYAEATVPFGPVKVNEKKPLESVNREVRADRGRPQKERQIAPQAARCKIAGVFRRCC